jgi:hypothetical protein
VGIKVVPTQLVVDAAYELFAALLTELVHVLQQEESGVGLANQPGELKHKLVPFVPKMGAALLFREALTGRPAREQIEASFESAFKEQSLGGQVLRSLVQAAARKVMPEGFNGAPAGVERG